MTRTALVIALGVLAAFGFAWSAFLQQRASTHLAGHPGTALARSGMLGATRLLRRLLRSPAWFLGWLVNLVAFFVQAAALHLGSVAAVQPLMTTQVLFTIMLSSGAARQRPRLLDWVSGIAICGGIVLLMLVDGAAPMHGAADRGRVLLITFAALALVALLVGSSRLRPTPALAAVLLACAAGVCFAMTATFIKLTTDDLIQRGVAATARDWVGYALAGSTGIGLALGQLSHAAGPLPWSMAAMNITNPVVSYVCGMTAFNADLPTSPGALAGITGAAALLALGVVGLVRSPSIVTWAPEDSMVETTRA